MGEQTGLLKGKSKTESLVIWEQVDCCFTEQDLSEQGFLYQFSLRFNAPSSEDFELRKHPVVWPALLHGHLGGPLGRGSQKFVPVGRGHLQQWQVPWGLAVGIWPLFHMNGRISHLCNPSLPGWLHLSEAHVVAGIILWLAWKKFKKFSSEVGCLILQPSFTEVSMDKSFREKEEKNPSISPPKSQGDCPHPTTKRQKL